MFYCVVGAEISAMRSEPVLDLLQRGTWEALLRKRYFS